MDRSGPSGCQPCACWGGLVKDAVGHPRAPRIVCGACEESDRFVRLETHFASTGPDGERRFDHPFRLSSENWKAILQSLTVQTFSSPFLFFTRKQPEIPVFTVAEVDYLSLTLSKAFADARPEEWVVFALSQPESAGIMRMTAGGWFLQGAQLHFMLANYREAVTMPGIREGLRKKPLHPNTGRNFDLVPGTYHTAVKNTSFVGSLRSSSPSELSVAYQPLLLATAGTHPIAPLSNDTDKLLTDQMPLSPQTSLEERLEALKRWRDQGLITEEEYQTRKKQLLDRL